MALCKKPAIIGTTQVTGNFMAIQILSDAVLDVTPISGSTFVAYQDGSFDPAPLTGIILSKGTTIYLQFTAVKLVSGLAIAYADPFR